MSAPTPPTWAEMFRVFGRIGVLSFGGPAAQIALMEEELVTRHRWLNDAEFLRALGFCTLLPGPEAMQLATYAGWRLRATPGGLLAGALFVLPGAAVMLALTLAWLAWGQVTGVQEALVGIKAAVLVIVAMAVLRLSHKALKSRIYMAVAVLAFAALFTGALPFPVVLGLAALVGFAQATETATPATGPAPSLADTLRTALLWGAVWWLPLGAIWLADPGGLLWQIGAFFSWLAVVTFGGAYAVLAFMAEVAVKTHGWLDAPAMIDGLGLAETTPGPLILVTLFVGTVAGEAQGGLSLALAAAGVTLWATFVPCFLWVLAGAPWIERLAGMPRLQGALQGITAAVVGVIANLSLWFAIHVLFDRVNTLETGPLRLSLPDITSLDLAALSLLGLAVLLLAVVRIGLLRVLVICAIAGWALARVVGAA